ncbi:MAG: beta-lactamase family protein [Acidobacteria bacterium]|nr:beta-lactamase family protein [Acidobacteriota bacterium]
MPRSRTIISLLTIILLPAVPLPRLVSAQQQKIDFGPLEKAVADELKDTGAPGAAVVLVSGDQIVYANGFGVASIETQAPVTPAMLFRLGATTRMFTATALVMLAEEGKIRLDEPVGRYIKGLSPKLSQVTTHQLLTSTAGLKDEALIYGPHDDAALADGIRSWKDDYFIAAPGQKFFFSNPGYWLAGLVLEEVTGKPFADQMSDRLFKPLGMNSSTFRPTMAMTYPLVQGHDTYGKEQPVVVRPAADHAGTWPSGSLFSSASDLARFVMAFMNGGRIEGREILTPAVIAKLSTPYIEIPGTSRSYGYGLIINEYRGVRLLRHGGGRLGYGSLIVMAPKHRFAVIILTNRNSAVFNQSAEKALELMLPLTPKPGLAATVAIKAAEMANYVGVYSDPPGRAEILIRDGQLFLKEYGLTLPVNKTVDNRFLIAPPLSSRAEVIELVPGSDGRTEYLRRGGRTYKRVLP